MTLRKSSQIVTAALCALLVVGCGGGNPDPMERLADATEVANRKAEEAAAKAEADKLKEEEERKLKEEAEKALNLDSPRAMNRYAIL